jgi:DNA mismatch repair protein MSH2
MEELHDRVAQLDALLAMAETAHAAVEPYVRPKIFRSGEGNGIVFKQLRHPVLEAQPDMRFIPNDVSLVRGKSSFAIITGPNMGGKCALVFFPIFSLLLTPDPILSAFF